MMTFENDALLIFSDASGVYIPQRFAQEMVRENITGVSDEDWKILEAGPDEEWYWDTWTSVLDNAKVTDPSAEITYVIWQDGDVFLVPEGVEIPEF